MHAACCLPCQCREARHISATLALSCWGLSCGLQDIFSSELLRPPPGLSTQQGYFTLQVAAYSHKLEKAFLARLPCCGRKGQASGFEHPSKCHAEHCIDQPQRGLHALLATQRARLTPQWTARPRAGRCARPPSGTAAGPGSPRSRRPGAGLPAQPCIPRHVHHSLSPLVCET